MTRDARTEGTEAVQATVVGRCVRCQRAMPQSKVMWSLCPDCIRREHHRNQALLAELSKHGSEVGETKVVNGIPCVWTGTWWVHARSAPARADRKVPMLAPEISEEVPF